MALVVHVVAGVLGLLSGAIALSAAKGAGLHRKSGLLFVGAMVAMSTTGVWIAYQRNIETNAIGGLLAAYLVVTSLATVQPAARMRWLDVGAMLMALGVGLTSVTLGVNLILRGKGSSHGVPVPMIFFLGGIALLASAGDFRMIRSGGIQGARRLARHLWRMCFALFIATGSFFLGQAQVFPKEFRIPALLAIPALAPLPILLYWLWRVRAKRYSSAVPEVSSH